MIVIMTMIVSVGLLREIDAASESIDAAIVRLQWTLSLSFSSRRCDVTLRVTRNHLGSFVFKSTILCLACQAAGTFVVTALDGVTYRASSLTSLGESLLLLFQLLLLLSCFSSS